MLMKCPTAGLVVFFTVSALAVGLGVPAHADEPLGAVAEYGMESVSNVSGALAAKVATGVRVGFSGLADAIPAEVSNVIEQPQVAVSDGSRSLQPLEVMTCRRWIQDRRLCRRLDPRVPSFR
ncbi:hypothetical protein GCM10007382_11100 [Salinibacterium xinjiangense]|nr:hypothetical protein GCM10007382_11100 [Salinibacterium xinjiangense]